MSGYYILDEVRMRTTASGKSFASGKLSDASGNINFVMWDGCTLTAEDIGKIVCVEAVVDKYRDELQAKLFSIYVAEDCEIDALDMQSLIPMAPIDIGKAWFDVGDKLFEVWDSPYAQVALELILCHAAEVQSCPAAKSVHHAYVGGWLMHVANMLEMAEHS